MTPQPWPPTTTRTAATATPNHVAPDETHRLHILCLSEATESAAALSIAATHLLK